MKTAFCVAFNRRYILPFHCLLNSIIEYCPDQDIIIIYESVDKDRDCNEYIDYLKNSNYANRFKFIPGYYPNIQNDRYIPLADLVDQYDSICHLDADMFLVSNLDVYFNISANSDVIVGVRDFSDRFYHDKNYINKDGSTDFPTSCYLSEFICCVPMWLNKSNKEYFKDLATTIKEDKPNNFGDMENINIKIVTRGLQNRLLALPCEQFVQARFSFMNPITRIGIKHFDGADIKKNSKLADKIIVSTQCSHAIKTIHGKFYEPSWVKFFQDEFDRHLYNSFYFTDVDFKHDGNCAASNLKRLAFESLSTGSRLFKFFLNKHIAFPEKFYDRQEERDFLDTVPCI